MSFISNFIWFILVGLIGGLLWTIAGILCCITIVGIPLGIQCFKFAWLTMAPFGKDVTFNGGTVSMLANILWIGICGWEMAVFFSTVGVLFCVSIIGFPLGLQCFKFAKLALFPFGAEIG